MMELLVERYEIHEAYTLGRMSVVTRTFDEYLGREDKEYLCDTLEPRYIPHGYGTGRVHKKVAIPKGHYPVVITYDNRSGRWLPQILKVRGFKTVHIHVGKIIANIRGGMIIGQHYKDGRIVNSPSTVFDLKQMIVKAKAKHESVFMTIN